MPAAAECLPLLNACCAASCHDRHLAFRDARRICGADPPMRGTPPMEATQRLVPSLDLVHRVTEAAAAYTIARMRVLERIPGNPIGIFIQERDNVVALIARHLPSPPFNSVVGLREGQAGRIQPLLEWYRAHGAAVRFEIAAGDDDSA